MDQMKSIDWRTPARWTALTALVVGALVATGLSIFNDRLGAINLGGEWSPGSSCSSAPTGTRWVG